MLAHLGYRAKVEVYESNWKRSAAAPVFRLCQSSVLRTQSSLPAVSCQPGQGSISVCGLWSGLWPAVCGLRSAVSLPESHEISQECYS